MAEGLASSPIPKGKSKVVAAAERGQSGEQASGGERKEQIR